MRGLRPPLKWPGGKTRELPKLAPFVPATVRDYYEPFVGGGAMLWRVGFDGVAFANDVNESLMGFYRAVVGDDPAFRRRLSTHIEVWDALAPLARAVITRFEAGGWGAPVGEHAETVAAETVRDACPPALRTLEPLLVERLIDKLRRVERLQVKHGVTFTPAQWSDHVETAIRAGYYTAIRDTTPDTDPGRAAADFFFVREMCYGSMFRFNRDGKFNIPYGGIAYNKKDLAGKIAYLYSAELQERLSRCTFTCDDFGPFFERHRRMNRADFVFVDPPYDSDFSAYDNQAFSLDDHQRLADGLRDLRASWLLVIKETPDVERIYGPLSALDHVRDGRFAKSYTYNVRGRNERDVVHRVWVSTGR